MDPFFVYVETHDRPKMLWGPNKEWAQQIATAEMFKGNEAHVYKLDAVYKAEKEPTSPKQARVDVVYREYPAWVAGNYHGAEAAVRMTAYDRGRREGLKFAAAIARRWCSDEMIRARWENCPVGVRLPEDEDVVGRAAEREYRSLVTGIELTARGIVQEIEALLEKE